MAKILDNTPDAWGIDAINWAVENKILLGDDVGNYKLHEVCTRQDALIFLHRYEENVK